MLDFLRKHATFAVAAIALTLSACNTFTDLKPLPNTYEGSETITDTALVTLKNFKAAELTVEQVCTPAEPGTDLATLCVTLIKSEQVLRPAVKAAGLVAAEYADIDARIRELGPDAPAEWLALAAETAGRLTAAYDPVRTEIDAFISKAGALTNG